MSQPAFAGAAGCTLDFSWPGGPGEEEGPAVAPAAQHGEGCRPGLALPGAADQLWHAERGARADEDHDAGSGLLLRSAGLADAATEAGEMQGAAVGSASRDLRPAQARYLRGEASF